MAEKHYFEQQKHTENYLISYFDQHLAGWRNFNILEAGCAEAGCVRVLSGLGVSVSGVELMPNRVRLAKRLNPDLNVEIGDITDPKIGGRFSRRFDMIIMRDVIEHIPNRDALFRNLRALLKPGGILYLTFPPRFSPFGGHHQNGRTILKRAPYLQLLPAPAIRHLGKLFHEQEPVIEETVRNFNIGLSIHALNQWMKMYGFAPVLFELFISRPVYRTRFGWPVIRFPNLPFLCEFLATGCECLLKKCSDA